MRVNINIMKLKNLPIISGVVTVCLIGIFLFGYAIPTRKDGAIGAMGVLIIIMAMNVICIAIVAIYKKCKKNKSDEMDR
jgi:biotin transporter BioY